MANSHNDLVENVIRPKNEAKMDVVGQNGCLDVVISYSVYSKHESDAKVARMSSNYVWSLSQ